MGLVQRIDDYGRPAWIGLMVVSFVLFWPVGLAVLAFLIWSGRMGMGCWKGERGQWGRRWREMKQEWGPGAARAWTGPSSGNAAFDEYREATLRRLEAEQKEFYAFLQRLRHAKDKQEFDQFMAERQAKGGADPSGPAA